MPSKFSNISHLILQSTLAVLFQTECLHCGVTTSTGGLCPSCEKFRILPPLRCEKCGYPTPTGISTCGRCRNWHGLKSVRSELWLQGAARDLLLRAKFSGEWEWLDYFRNYIQTSNWTAALPNQSILVSVPLDSSRHRERGFNQSEILAHWLSEEIGFPVVGLLKKVRYSQAQSLLTQKERLKNLRDTFSVDERMLKAYADRPVVLVDDVVTTGSTLRECAKTLKRQGVRSIFAWTLFRAASII